MFAALLGILDIFAASVLIWPQFWAGILFFLGAVYFVKGSMSIMGSFLSGFWFEFMGLIDVLVGLSLIFMFDVPLLWVFLLAKGIFSVLTGW